MSNVGEGAEPLLAPQHSAPARYDGSADASARHLQDGAPPPPLVARPHKLQPQPPELVAAFRRLRPMEMVHELAVSARRPVVCAALLGMPSQRARALVQDVKPVAGLADAVPGYMLVGCLHLVVC